MPTVRGVKSKLRALSLESGAHQGSPRSAPSNPADAPMWPAAAIQVRSRSSTEQIGLALLAGRFSTSLLSTIQFERICRSGNTLYNATCTYGILGKKAEALEPLKKAFAAGYGNPNWAAKDSDLDCLHDDPEFQKLVGGSEGSAS
jgi:hypothetical protein